MRDSNKDKITMNFASTTAIKIESPNKRFQVQSFAGSFNYSQTYNTGTIFWDSVKKYYQHIHNKPHANARFTIRLLSYAGGASKILSKFMFNPTI